MPIATKSGFCGSVGFDEACGKFVGIACRRIMLRLTSMKLASRKNMMSIKGMISIRAFLPGVDDESCMVAVAEFYTGIVT